MRFSRVVLIVSTLALISGGYWYFFVRTTKAVTSTTTIVVSTGSIRNTIKSTGKISPIQSTSLSFTKQGAVSKIYKKVWDPVKAWEVIAEIDAKSAYMDIENAKISLENAKNNYDKLYKATTESDKIRAKNTLTESETTLKLLQSQYDNLLLTQQNTIRETEANIKLLQEQVNLARSELEYTKKNANTDTTSNNLEKDLANGFQTIEDAARIIPDMMKSFKDVTMIDDKSNPRYGDLSARDAWIKSQTESLYTALVQEITAFNSDLINLRNSSPKTFDATLKTLGTTSTLFTRLSTLSTLIVSEYDNSIESNNMTSTYISGIKSSMNSYGTTLGSKLSSINSYVATLKWYGTADLIALSNKNTIASKEQALLSAENTLTNAKSSYEALKKSQATDRISKEQDITKQKDTILLNQTLYNELIQGPTNTDLISAENSIASAEISLEKANLNLRDYQIIATFDGVINDIPWAIGDTTQSTEWVLIENKDMYQIALSLDQIDIVKVKKWMHAQIVLDAFPTDTYTWVVDRVSAVPTETSGVVSYEAIISLVIPRTDIYTKMSATVEITTTDKNNILVIPASAISMNNGVAYVQKVTDPAIISSTVANFRSRGNQRSFSGSLRSGSGNELSQSGYIRRSGSGGFSWSATLTGSGRSYGGNRIQKNNSLTYGLTTTQTINTTWVPITTGLTDGQYIEVTSGLESGDVVAITKSSSTTSSSSGSSTSSTSRRNTGFGGPPPGF